MRRDDKARFVIVDSGDYIIKWGWGKLLVSCGAIRLRFDNLGVGRRDPLVKNLRPAIAKPAIANNQYLFMPRKLPCHSFHRKAATARNKGA